MKKISFFIALFVSITAPIFAQHDVPEFIKNAPGLEDYPDQDGLILKNEITITLGTDGIVTRHYRRAMKVLDAWCNVQDAFRVLFARQRS